MSRPALRVIEAGPAMGIQDMGRTGTLALGLSPGGAADRLALIEAGALLGQPADCAALEMAVHGGSFEAEAPLRIALTGAGMAARIDGQPVAWHASHALAAGQRLTLGAARRGVYGYLSVGGGFDTPAWLGSRSVQPSVGLGAALAAGDVLAVGADAGGLVGRTLEVADRFSGGEVRVLPGPQTAMFDADTRARFAATAFRRDARGNRQGVRLIHDGAPFAAEGGLSVLSEAIVPGDIQMTGEGTPFVLLPDSQTTGGYPRIATVVPNDLPLVAQAPPGATLRFRFITHDEALADHRKRRAALAELAARVRPLVRDPGQLPDLLTRQLISGVTAGETEEETR